MIISLIGYMGSGKTTLGRELSKKLNYTFFDLDEYIEKKKNKKISQIFKEKGEIQFRKLEHEALKELLNKDKIILSVGGGTPVFYNNMELLNEKTQTFYLRLTPLKLAERLKAEKENRPLIAHLEDDSIAEFIAKHLFERKNFYEKSKFILDIKTKTTQESIDEIIHLLQLPK